jgi:ferric-dicitrate binding protein FerR (iron transport regulator)
MESIENENVESLIRQYLDGMASAEEVKALGNWVESSEENRKYFQQVKNLLDVTDIRNSKMKIDVDNAFEDVLNRIEEKPQGKTWVKTMQKIAAILLIPLVISGYFLGRKTEHKSDNSSVAYNEIYASLGTRSKVVLADGSKVWLNSGSKLRYPDKFTSNDRIVFLTGEAYFEVQSDVNRPFIVQTKQINVRATGTSFNVQAIDSDQEVNVSLLSGKVTVNKSNEGKVETLINLLPNQRFSFNIQTGSSQTFSGDLYEFIAWKDGRLVFRNKPLNEVVKRISQHYNIDIELRGSELQDYRYRATFEEESLNEILKLLKMSSPIKYTEVSRVRLSDSTFSKRKIIISPL